MNKIKLEQLIQDIEKCHYIDTSSGNEDYDLIIECVKECIKRPLRTDEFTQNSKSKVYF